MLHQLERRIGSRVNLSRVTIGKVRVDTAYRELACLGRRGYSVAPAQLGKPDGGEVGEQMQTQMQQTYCRWYNNNMHDVAAGHPDDKENVETLNSRTQSIRRHLFKVPIRGPRTL